MKAIKNKNALYEEPKLQIARLTETDFITTSADPFKDEEGEIVPVKIEDMLE